MFTQECFIRNNTKSLQYKLEKLGYKKSVFFQGDLPFIYVGDSNTLGAEYNEANYDAPILFHTNNSKIDCGTNEELFLAIAALRDDSDYMQWFVSKGWKDGFGNVEDKWVLCDQDTLEYFGAVNNSPNTYNRKKYPEFGWHKATVKELIEHFKTE